MRNTAALAVAALLVFLLGFSLGLRVQDGLVKNVRTWQRVDIHRP